MSQLNKFTKKQKLYRDVFNTSAGEKVLADLAIFCHQYTSTFVPGDSNATAHNEGMRRVYLRIHSYLNKDEKEINKIIDQYRKGEY